VDQLFDGWPIRIVSNRTSGRFSIDGDRRQDPQPKHSGSRGSSSLPPRETYGFSTQSAAAARGPKPEAEAASRPRVGV
jgi:hypothetical protein